MTSLPIMYFALFDFEFEKSDKHAYITRNNEFKKNDKKD